LRFGVSAATTRGFGTGEFAMVGGWIADLLDLLANRSDTAALETEIRRRVVAMTARFPIYAG
jgi:glycine hydroxymethyltransferase